MARYINADKLIENCEFFETEMEVKNAPTEDVVERNSVLEMLSKINNAVEDGDGFQYEEWVEYVKDIPSAEKTTLSAEKTTITDGDLISRKEIIIKAKEEAKGMEEPFKSNFAILVEWLIEKLPSAEKTAEWKEDNEDYFCSNCGYKYSALDEEGCPIPDKYCPNCGAKMKGVEE